MNPGVLYVVATPIGNLDDLSPRAREVLAAVDLIAAEDTRRTGRLLKHFGIDTRQTALHEHNEDAVDEGLVRQLLDGRSLALVSDAGTPLISDPGYRLVRAAREAEIAVSPVPGPSAAIAALSVSGLPTDRFCFEGFLPSKKGARAARLRELKDEPRTIVMFESVHRIGETLDAAVQAFGRSRRAFLGRELCKLYEQCVSATLGELGEMTADGRIASKGEFVLAIEGQREAETPTVSMDLGELLRAVSAVMPGSQAVDVVASLARRRRNDVYRMLLDQQRDAADD